MYLGEPRLYFKVLGIQLRTKETKISAFLGHAYLWENTQKTR